MRVVVSKRVAGLGSCLVSLFRAWCYARRTNRCLIVDWRNSMYLQSPTVNLFDVLFENRANIADVPIVTGDAVSTAPYKGPFLLPAGITSTSTSILRIIFLPLPWTRPIRKYGSVEWSSTSYARAAPMSRHRQWFSITDFATVERNSVTFLICHPNGH